MVSTPEESAGNSSMSSVKYVPVKQPSARKLLHQFTETLDFKPKNYFLRLCAAKLNSRVIRAGSVLWYSIPKRRSHTKINDFVKKYL